MGRPRQFDENAVLERAMKVFWEKGYEAASLPDLLIGMGLTRGSFYKAFKDKRSVYLAALRFYGERVVSGAIRILEADEPASGHERIQQLFASQIALMNTPQARRGCFLCKAAVDRAPHDREVERTVLEIVGSIEEAFGRAAVNGLPGAVPVDALVFRKAGAPLAAIYIGIQVLRNAGSGVETIKGIVNNALKSLESLSGQPVVTASTPR